MMKTYKKSTLLLGLAMLSGGTIAAKTKDEELLLITSIHTKVFSQSNLFDKRNEETNDWYDLLDNIQKYVDKNASKNKKLLDAFALCQDISYQLINTLKIAYNSIFAVASPSSTNISSIRDDIGQLVESGKILETAKNQFESEYYFWRKKKDVKEVLLLLMLTLELTITKLSKDFEKQVEKKGF